MELPAVNPMLYDKSHGSARSTRIVRLIKLVCLSKTSARWTMAPTHKKSLGRVIAHRRVHRGLQQKELAQRAMVAASTVSRLEGGQSAPTFATMVLIARALNTTVSDLYTEAWGSGAP